MQTKVLAEDGVLGMDLTYLAFILFIAVIAGIVQLVEMVVERFLLRFMPRWVYSSL